MHRILSRMILLICLLPGCGIRQRIREIDQMPMVRIPAGEFTMGSNEGHPNQAPAHQVFLSPYWIDQYEVTNAQYAVCVEAGACSPPWAYDSETRSVYYEAEEFVDFPIQATTFALAEDYCEWVGGRLPTEAEWEKAARSTDVRRYPWGEALPDCEKANFDRCVGDTDAVDMNPAGASPYGVMGMSGNVWEWTSDWYASDTYQSHTAKNPVGPANGSHRVIRGGSWLTDAESLQTTYRFFSDPGFGWNSIGIRCVVE